MKNSVNEKYYYPVERVPNAIMQVGVALPIAPIKPIMPILPPKPELRYSSRLLYFMNTKQERVSHQEDLLSHSRVVEIVGKFITFEYPERIKKWEAQIKSLGNPEVISEYRDKLLSSIVKASDAPRKHPASAYLRKGITEKRVLDTLASKFPCKVHVDGTALNKENTVDDWSPIPDFVIHDSKFGYNVVIEIDEPYDLFYGFPIHCNEQENVRDNYFLEQNWLVLRFAEIQFVNQPDECCDYIANFINTHTRSLYDLPVTGIYKKLEKVECWSHDDAVHKELIGFRESYLPSNLYKKASDSGVYTTNWSGIRKIRRDNKLIKSEKSRISLREKNSTLMDDSSDNDLPF